MEFKIDRRVINRTDVLTKVAKETNIPLSNVRDIISYLEQYTLDQINNDLEKPFIIPFLGKIKRKKSFIKDYTKHD